VHSTPFVGLLQQSNYYISSARRLIPLLTWYTNRPTTTKQAVVGPSERASVLLIALATAGGQSGVSLDPTTSSIRNVRSRLASVTRACRLNRSRSLISAVVAVPRDFDVRRCVSGFGAPAARMRDRRVADVVGRPAGNACCVARGQYVVEQVDIFRRRSIDRAPTERWRAINTRIENHGGADGNIRSASACFHSNR